MPRLSTAIALMLMLLFAASPALAQSWRVDPDHSQVLFTVRHVAGEVSGFFNGIQGRVEFDPEHPRRAHIDIQVIVSSLDTGVAERDRDLLGPDYFDAGSHPTIRFVSDDVEDKGGEAFVAHGHLTVKDVSRSADLPFEILGVARSPLPGQPCTEIMGLRGRLGIDRLEYNVGGRGAFEKGMVDNEVALTIRAELTRRLPDCQPGNQ